MYVCMYACMHFSRTVGMPHFRGEAAFRRGLGVVFGEFEHGVEESTFVQGVWGAEDGECPLEQIAAVNESAVERAVYRVGGWVGGWVY